MVFARKSAVSEKRITLMFNIKICNHEKIYFGINFIVFYKWN